MNRAPVATVVGRGAVTCLGIGVESFLEGLFAGRCGLAPRRRLAAARTVASVAGELTEADLAQIDAGGGLAFDLAMAAAREALFEAQQLDPGASDRSAIALVLASAKGDLSGVTEAAGIGARQRSTESAPPGLGLPARLVERVASALELGGPRAAVSCACASGLSALALARRWIASGRAARVLVVGVDALCPFIVEGFESLQALDSQACRPFDRHRRGLSLGEGAGALLLSAHPCVGLGCTIAGSGESNDANHVTGPSRDGAGLASAIERALATAQLEPRDVDVVHLHGTGTSYNDAMEGRAVTRALGRSPPACGIKGQVGHTLGASGLLESVVAIESLRRAVVPGNVGLSELDPDIALDLAPRARPLAQSRVALKLAAGFGGINAAIAFRRSEPR